MFVCVIEVKSSQKEKEEDKIQQIEIIKREIENTKIDIALNPTEEIIELPQLIDLGEFILTAYCSCEKCCNGYALNRPVDENGNEIVIGSSGEVLQQGVSVAVDINIIPYYTEIIINENIYIAHDTGGAIKGNRIDVYFNDHQKALEFGKQYANIYIYAN